MNMRAHQRRAQRRGDRQVRNITAVHGQVWFTMDRFGHMVEPVQTPDNMEAYTASTFPGHSTGDYMVLHGVMPSHEIISWASLAYVEAAALTEGLVLWTPLGNRAPAFLVGACCEHLREDMAQLHGVMDEDLRDLFTEMPTGWLAWVIAPCKVMP